MAWLFTYYAISGLLTLLWFVVDVECVHSEEAEDAIADVTWHTGVKRAHVKALLYIMALVLGWLILPYEIISRFVEKEGE